MIDVHNHILYGIDDGSPTIEKSIEILQKAYEVGYREFILTPHFIEDTDYICNNRSKLIRLRNLQKKVKQINLPVELYLGNEVHIHDDIIKNIKDKKIMPLNNGKYLLLELPFRNRYHGTEDIIFELTRHDIVPVIAHVERYQYITEKDIERFIDLGCLIQGNALSLTGKYGKDAEKKLKMFLKKNMIHVLCSDAHTVSAFEKLKDIKRVVKKIVKKDEIIEDLFKNNARKIINNETIIPYQIKEKEECKIFGWFQRKEFE